MHTKANAHARSVANGGSCAKCIILHVCIVHMEILLTVHRHVLTVEPLLKDIPNNAKLCGPYRTMTMQFYLLTSFTVHTYKDACMDLAHTQSYKNIVTHVNDID